MLIAALAIDALDMVIRHRTSRLDQDVLNAMGLRPVHEGLTDELGVIVGAHRLEIPEKQRGRSRGSAQNRFAGGQ